MRIIIAMAFLLFSLGINAQHISMFQDGKAWNYYSLMNKYASFYSVLVSGDTLVDGRTCKKLVKQAEGEAPELYAVMYEEDGKVYLVLPNGKAPKLLYDFTLKEGDNFCEHDVYSDYDYVVSEVSNVKNCGREYKRIVLNAVMNPARRVVWVEGMGVEKSLTNSLDIAEGDYSSLVSCELDGNTVFTFEGFTGDGGQPTYLTMVEEGRRWEYRNGEAVLSYTVCGDTMMGGREYKQLYRQESLSDDRMFQCGIREADRRVYALFPGDTEETMLFEFGLSRIGDECVDGDGNIIQLRDCSLGKTSDGKERRCESVVQFHSNNARSVTGPFTWMEGVGSVNYIPFEKQTPSGSLLGCYDDKVCIVSADDVSVFEENEPSRMLSIPPKSMQKRYRQWNYRYRSDDTLEPVEVHQWMSHTFTYPIIDVTCMMLFEYNPVRYGDEYAYLRAMIREDSDDVYWEENAPRENFMLMRQGMETSEECEIRTPSGTVESCRMVQAYNISSAGHTYRRMQFMAPDGQVFYWLEGIGFEDCGLCFGPDHERYELVSVYDGTECIYNTQWEVPAFPDIPSIPTKIVVSKSAVENSVGIFDLQGRRVTGTPQHGLYIRDGRKVLK